MVPLYNTVKCNGLHALTMNNIIKAFINLGKRCNLCKKKKNVNALCILFDLVVKAYFTLKFFI